MRTIIELVDVCFHAFRGMKGTDFGSIGQERWNSIDDSVKRNGGEMVTSINQGVKGFNFLRGDQFTSQNSTLFK